MSRGPAKQPGGGVNLDAAKLDRIRKLLRLATSNPNEAEGASARERAEALMAEHNLTPEQVALGTGRGPVGENREDDPQTRVTDEGPALRRRRQVEEAVKLALWVLMEKRPAHEGVLADLVAGIPNIFPNLSIDRQWAVIRTAASLLCPATEDEMAAAVAAVADDYKFDHWIVRELIEIEERYPKAFPSTRELLRYAADDGDEPAERLVAMKIFERRGGNNR